MKTTTLAKIRVFGPCKWSWEDLLKGLEKRGADNEPLRLGEIKDILGIHDALWAVRTQSKPDAVELACMLVERYYGPSPSPEVEKALQVARANSKGSVTIEEVQEAIQLIKVEVEWWENLTNKANHSFLTREVCKDYFHGKLREALKRLGAAKTAWIVLNLSGMDEMKYLTDEVLRVSRTVQLGWDEITEVFMEWERT